MRIIQNRRHFLAGAAAAGSAALFNIRPSSAAGEPPPETTTVRLGKWEAPCWAAVFLAGELMRADGITDVRWVTGDTSVDNSQWLARGDTDFDMNMPSMHITSIEAGVPIKVLTGVHTGCFELIANDSVRTVMDMRGKRVGVYLLDSHPHKLTSLMANYVGLDPVHDIQWVVTKNPTQDFLDGKVDVVLTATPEPQMLRARKDFTGHTIVNIEVDRPWSQYFCCMVAGSTDYVTKYPVATKRVVRAIVKAADFCASNPALAAQELIDRGFLPDYDYALGTLNAIGHDKWRDYDPEDSVRFYALRMKETGMIKSSPQEIIANGTEFRFVNELKRELKT